MRKGIIGSHLQVLVLALLGGFLSGAVQPLGFGLRGGIVSVGLALALVAGNWASRRRLDRGQVPSLWPMAWSGLLFGFLAGLAASVVPAPAGGLERLGPSWATLTPALLGAAYGLACHSAYWCRWRYVGLWPVAWRVALAGLACGALRAGVTILALGPDSELPGIEVIVVPMVSLSGAWFALLWFWAVALGDPAWSLARWRRVSAPPAAPDAV